VERKTNIAKTLYRFMIDVYARTANRLQYVLIDGRISGRVLTTRSDRDNRVTYDRRNLINNIVSDGPVSTCLFAVTRRREKFAYFTTAERVVVSHTTCHVYTYVYSRLDLICREIFDDCRRLVRVYNIYYTCVQNIILIVDAL